MSRPDRPTTGLALLLAASGVLHLVRPGIFTGMVPTPLKKRDKDLVIASGVAEIACGAGLLVPATRPVAGLASAALLAAVFPANVQMSIDRGRRAQRKQTPEAIGTFAGSLVRLPAQWPLIRAAVRAARQG